MKSLTPTAQKTNHLPTSSIQGAAARPQHLNKDGGGREDEQQQNDGNQIHWQMVPALWRLECVRKTVSHLSGALVKAKRKRNIGF